MMTMMMTVIHADTPTKLVDIARELYAMVLGIAGSIDDYGQD